jgi:hypothetical protein
MRLAMNKKDNQETSGIWNSCFVLNKNVGRVEELKATRNDLIKLISKSSFMKHFVLNKIDTEKIIGMS